MQSTRTRYQQGNIRKVKRASGFGWEVRFSGSRGEARYLKCHFFKGEDYPTEASVRGAVVGQSAPAHDESRSGRDEVWATFRNLTALSRLEELPEQRHLAKQKNESLLKEFLEPRWVFC